MKRWYVLQTKPQKESMVASLLRLAGYRTFFPVVKNCFGARALFPSYVFVELEAGSARDYRMAGFTRGAVRILGTQLDGPIAVPDSVMQFLMKRANAVGIISQELFQRAGEMVKVQKGLLKDLVGILEKPVDATGRLRVLFKMFNRSIKAVLHTSEVLPAHALN